MPAALITGSAKRLGRAMALELAEAGYDVAIHYAGSAEAAEETARDARAAGVRAITLQADLLDPAAVDTLVSRAADGLGQPLTVLINNASIFEHDDIHSATAESWTRHIDSNLRAPLFLTQAFAAQCPKGARDAQGEAVASGLVVNMLDQRVRKLTPEFMTYTLAKMGLWALTRTAAQGLAPDIRVNGIGPGPTMQGARQSAAHFAAQRAATILERGSSPEEIRRALRFLLESPGVTGQLLCMDGGQHLAWRTPDVLGVE
ncbi:SDR family oxidoreductase [Oceanibium sediminis]|uniref:SDR family oxidoreductase n=1 Tax=Oceanibium sediminis TaxID=2026339 RepID=UPI000DD37672|nr:SDR family oxidoreductase [Oceanibium sediminis]